MAGPQRGTPARGKRQGVLDRAEKKYGKLSMYDPSKINQFRGRGIFPYEESPIDKEEAISKRRPTMSEKDRDLAVRSEIAESSMRMDRLREENPRMYLAIKQSEMDKVMRDRAERFRRSSESDSPGYNKGGKIKKMVKGGSLPDLTGDGKITRADVLKGRGVFKKGGMVKSSASRRADGIAQRGKTKGRFV